MPKKTTKKQSMPDFIPFDEPSIPEKTEQPSETVKKPTGPKTVVYFGRLPEGFFEPQLYSYCSQFGSVSRLRMPRSRKTNKMRGYAFVEFENGDVAKLVAETMNGYLMFERLLVCKVLDAKQNQEELFKDWDKFRRPKSDKHKRWLHNRPKSAAARANGVVRRERRLKDKCAKASAVFGVDLLGKTTD